MVWHCWAALATPDYAGQVAIPAFQPLKSNGVTKSMSKDKAEILNNQFFSVFTEEDLSYIPETSCLFPVMPDVSFNTEGIYKLLLDLNIHKSPGPDEIPSQILKRCATEIAPVLQIIFKAFNNNN